MTNKAFTKAVAKALYRPTLVAIPEFIIKALGGLGREIPLADQKILPKAVLKTGYIFKDPVIEEAMMLQLRAQK